jgi:pimeloyl-ACP methyl ester carboxylesterase
LPVLVFIHGLGGSLAQFHPLLTSLTNVAPCFGIDLPGCGQSEFSPRNWDAYSHSALVELLDVVISDACDRAETQEAVLICHSMGCSLAASLLARGKDGSLRHADKVRGLIAICPKASLPTPHDITAFRRLLNIPSPLFDLFRAWDRRGGIQSSSVSRFVGNSASIETRKLQLRFNEQSKTDVWRRMAWGAVPIVGTDGTLHGGLPGPDAWARIAVPVFLIAGEADQVTKPKEIAIITKAIGFGVNAKANSTDNAHKSSQTPAISGLKSAGLKLKTTILPAPAAHGLLYDHSTYRTVSGLILTFLSDHIQPRLSMGWQLQHLKESNKWDVKNLAKWQAVIPVSGAIANIFRATKTLRESDEQHSPSTFVARWGNTFKAVIDISHDSPVYNPHDLEKGGIEYHKFPTVSKIPPTMEEVRDFIALVDQLRLEEKKSARDRVIGVHCHYGFNRTGFFICSYLIEREGYGVQKAVDEFAAARPPGIRHEHFLDTLFVRYCVGLKRSPTM